MGYKGKNDREKVRIELVARFIGAPDRRLQNRQWAKTDAMTSAFAHYGGNCQRKMWRCIKIEFFPKYGICTRFGKNSINGEYKEQACNRYLRPMQLWLKNQRKRENIIDFR